MVRTTERRVLGFLLALAMLAGLLSGVTLTAYADENGTAESPWQIGWGTADVTAWLTGDEGDKTLHIDGTGTMKAFNNAERPPWSGQAAQITAIAFETDSAVSIIGDDAFMGFTALTGVTVPASVTTIGDKVFMGCTSLASVTIPEGVKTIYPNHGHGGRGPDRPES